MKCKRKIRQLALGVFIVLFLVGLIISYAQIAASKYLSQHMFNLALVKATIIINKVILAGFLIAIGSLAFGYGLFIIWRSYLSKIIEVKLKRDKQLLYKVLKILSIIVICLAIAIVVVAFIKSPGQRELQNMLVTLLISLIVLYIILRIGRGKPWLVINHLRRRSSSAAIRIVGPSFFFLFLVANMFSLYHHYIKKPEGPNVILIVADTLRADHLGCYGYTKPTSPNIDKFASESLLFKNAWANASWTKPSMGSLFTSLFPHEHDFFFLADKLSSTNLTLTELFRNMDYKTIAFQTNPVLFKEHNFHQGFESYLELPPDKGKIVVDRFKDWLKNHNKKPFFAYLHFMTTHIPYESPEELSQIIGINNNEGTFIRLLTQLNLQKIKKESVIELYDRAIKELDWYLCDVLETLNKFDLKEKTIIIFTSDHGEELWDHGSFEHGHCLYNEVIKIPLIIHYPKAGHGLTIERNVQLKEIGPIIIGLAKDNFGQLEFLFSDKNKSKGMLDQSRSVIFSEGIQYGPEKNSVVMDKWKLIYHTGIKYKGSFELFGNTYGELTKLLFSEDKQGFELYDLAKDPYEKNNLIANYPEVGKELFFMINRIKMLEAGPREKSTINLDEIKEKLKSLGYLN